ncbi:MAG: Ig-like domain-containing protein [Thermoplasmata archaeon]
MILLTSNIFISISHGENIIENEYEPNSSSIGSISIQSDDNVEPGDIQISGNYFYNPNDYPDLSDFNMNQITVSLDSNTKQADYSNYETNYPFDITFNNVQEGTYFVTATAQYDYYISGEGWYNDCTSSTTQSLKVDGSNPNAVAEASPSLVTTDMDVQFDASDSTGTGPADVNYEWNFGDGNNSDSKNPTHRYSSTGNYTAKLWVNESIDGHTSSDTVSITVVDSLPPSINIDSPQEGSIVSMDPLEITWTGSDDNGIDYYNIKLDDQPYYYAESYEDSYTYDDVSDGSHTVEVVAKDLDGLTSRDYSNFTLDTQVPKPAINNPPQNQWFNSTDVTIEWSCDEPRLSHYEIMRDDDNYNNVGTDTSYTYSGLSEGSHHVKVKAVDTADNKETSDRRDFNIDLTEPNIDIINPSKDEFINTNQITVKWDGNDQYSGIEYYEINIDDQGWNNIGDVEEYDVNLNDGIHNIKVKSFDKVGFYSIDEVNLTVDSQSPSIQIDNPTEGNIIENEDITLSWTGIDDISGIDLFQLKIDNNTWINVGTDTTYDTVLYEGEHSVRVKAYDQADNFQIDQVNFTVDVSNPSLNIISPVNNSYHSNNTITIDWNGTDNGTGIDHYELMVGNNTWLNVGMNTSYEDTFSLENHSIKVKAVDGADHSIIDSVNFTVDYVEPSITILSPSNNTLMANKTITVNYNGSDNISGLNHYEINVDDDNWISTGLNDSYVLNLSDGTYEITVRAVDNAMNTNSTSIIIHIDTTAPNLNITSPGNSAIIKDKNVTFSWNSTDSGTDVDHFEVKIDGGIWKDVGLNYSYNYTFNDGNHTFKIKSYDVLGNNNTEELNFYVDLYSPVLQIINPKNNSFINQNNITIRWNGSDTSSGIDHYEIKLNNNSWMNVGTNESKDYVLDDGNHTICIKAVDNGNYNTTKCVNFTIDTVKPTLNITKPDDELIVDTNPIFFEWIGNDTGSSIKCYKVKFDTGDWMNVGLNRSYNHTLSDGNHTIWINVLDYANNSKILSKNITVDNKPPSISTISPNEGDILQKNNVSVEWEANDTGTNITKFKVSVDGNRWIDVEKNTTYECSLGNGHHTVRIKAYDFVGHTSIRLLNFTVDTKSPSVEIKKPSDSSYKSNTNLEVRWESDDSDGSGIDYHEINIDDQGWKDTGSDKYYNTELSDGYHEVRVKAYDKIGLYSIDVVNFTIDSQDPSIKITDPKDEDLLESKSVLVKWDGDDQESGISNYQIKTDDEWEDIENVDSYEISLDDGTHDISIKVFDKAGNTDVDRIQITVDSERPSIEIDTPKDDKCYNKKEIRIEWSANDTGSGISDYQIKINANSWITVNDNFYVVNLEESSHDISVKAYDGCNRYDIDNVTVVIDVSKPILTIDSPENGSVSPYKYVTCSWSSEDTYSGIEGDYIKLNDGDWTDVGNSEKCDVELKEGINEIYLKSVDFAGNKAIKSTDVIVDTSPPCMEVELNEGMTWTSEKNLDLFITPKDNIGEITLMSVYTENISKSNWTDFAAESQITLPESEGEHTVYVQITDEYGRKSEIVKKNVLLDLTKPEGNIKISNDTVGNKKINFKLECTDPYESIKSVLISSDEDLSNTEVYDYKPELNYTLPKTHGEHTLYYRFISEHGQKSPVYETKVFLDLKGPELECDMISNITKVEDLSGNLSWYSNDDSEISHYKVYKGYNDSQLSLLYDDLTANRTNYDFKDNKTIKLKIIGFDEFENENSINLTVKTDIDYPPEFKSLKIPDIIEVGKEKEWLVIVDDCKDDSVKVSWFVNGKKVSENNSYKPDLEPGEYKVKVVASDGNNTIRSSKTITVEDDNNIEPNFPWIWILVIVSVLSVLGGTGTYQLKNRSDDKPVFENNVKDEPTMADFDIDKTEVTKSVYRELNRATIDEAYTYLREQKGMPMDYEEFSDETMKLLGKEVLGLEYRGMDEKVYIWMG